MTAAWPLWPLFIAGCVVNDRWYRRLIEDSFETVMRRTPFGVRAFPQTKQVCSVSLTNELRVSSLLEKLSRRFGNRRTQNQIYALVAKAVSRNHALVYQVLLCSAGSRSYNSWV